MKNIFFTLFLLISASLFSQSAISIDVSDIADGGQSFIVSTANPIGEYDFEFTGDDVSWDFSSLESMAKDTIDWVDADDTDPLYFLLWFSSDVAEEFIDGISTDSFSIDNVFNFYDRSSSSLEQTGIAGTVSGIPLPASFSDPDIIYEFPLNFEDNYSSESGFEFDLLGFASFTESRSRETSVDGWGTLTTPLGEFEVLRLKSQIDIEDVFESGGTEFPVSYTNFEYKWLAKEMGIPVLQINTTDLGGFETITRIAYQDTADVIMSLQSQDNISQKMISVFPNPVENQINFSIESETSSIINYQITDLFGNIYFSSGDCFIHEGKNIFSSSFSLSTLSGGMYLVKILEGNNFIASQKFIHL